MRRCTFRPLTLLAMAFGLTLISSAGILAVEIRDDLGETVSLNKPARRIIPLYGAFAEMLYAIGAGPEVIARTQADQFPPEILKLPSVGTHMRPNVEMIIGLKPDLVIQSMSRREAMAEMERLHAAGIPIAVFSPSTFGEVFSAVERLGILTDRQGAAKDVVDQLKKRLEAVRGRLDGVEKRLRVFFEVRAEPLTAAGRGSIVQEIISLAGAENVIRNEKAIVQYNFEALLLDDPDIYVVQHGPMNRNPLDPKKRSHFEQLRSVREGRIVFVDEFLYSRPGPRCVDAVEQLAARLYPERFKGQ